MYYVTNAYIVSYRNLIKTPQGGTFLSPGKQKLPEQDCAAIRRILGRIGDKWSLYIVGTLQGGPMRFNENPAQR